VKKAIGEQSIIFLDQSTFYVEIANFVAFHITKKSTKQTTLKWVRLAIVNTKRNLTGNYHKIKRKYLQLYLNEFIYELNLRYFWDRFFDKFVIALIKSGKF
jgi:hypothetical protein